MHCSWRLARISPPDRACAVQCSALTISTVLKFLREEKKTEVAVVVRGELVSDLYFASDNRKFAQFSKHIELQRMKAIVIYFLNIY
jgi:hypothetical protein